MLKLRIGGEPRKLDETSDHQATIVDRFPRFEEAGAQAIEDLPVGSNRPGPFGALIRARYCTCLARLWRRWRSYVGYVCTVCRVELSIDWGAREQWCSLIIYLPTGTAVTCVLCDLQ
jgi:hypothetical protein